MLHLLPDSYIVSLQKEYRMRAMVAASNLISFCLFIFIVGMVPAFVSIKSEKIQLKEQNTNNEITIISKEDYDNIIKFESTVKRGIAIVKLNEGLSLLQLNYIISLQKKGVLINSINIDQGEHGENIQIQGIADNRSDLSNYIGVINTDGVYTVDDVPASMFTKYKDLQFSLVLKKSDNKNSK